MWGGGIYIGGSAPRVYTIPCGGGRTGVVRASGLRRTNYCYDRSTKRRPAKYFVFLAEESFQICEDLLKGETECLAVVVGRAKNNAGV